ncbi:hypothetical protein MSPP1_003626 [Malassezia sp. CBS 17886]|nr:hypothetical protein MSPP1_003626 [Malassezia sp. CBS 17886]
MGLSEQRKKQRLVGAATTRNSAWVNDNSLPGQRMLASMGWSPGTGLGTSGGGLATNLAVSVKLDNKGIGAHRHEREALRDGQADAWVGAGGDLSSLFDRLNEVNAAESAEDKAPTHEKPDSVPTALRPPASRLAHRAKFRRAKQMVGTSATSMNEILGITKEAEDGCRGR